MSVLRRKQVDTFVTKQGKPGRMRAWKRFELSRLGCRVPKNGQRLGRPSKSSGLIKEVEEWSARKISEGHEIDTVELVEEF